VWTSALWCVLTVSGQLVSMQVCSVLVGVWTSLAVLVITVLMSTIGAIQLDLIYSLTVGDVW
jgi:hypothetical protein